MCLILASARTSAAGRARLQTMSQPRGAAPPSCPQMVDRPVGFALASQSVAQRPMIQSNNPPPTTALCRFPCAFATGPPDGIGDLCDRPLVTSMWRELWKAWIIRKMASFHRYSQRNDRTTSSGNKSITTSTPHQQSKACLPTVETPAQSILVAMAMERLEAIQMLQ